MRSLTPQEFLYRDSFDECQRTGAVVAFSSFDEFLHDYETVLELFDQPRGADEPRFGMNAPGTPGRVATKILRRFRGGPLDIGSIIL